MGTLGLEAFADLQFIDGIAKNYNYTHGEAFVLEWDFVCNLHYMHLKQADQARRQGNLRRQLKAKPK